MPENPTRETNFPGPEQQPDIFTRVRQEVEQFRSPIINPRIIPALNLYAYNFFHEHPSPTPDELVQFKQRCLAINEREEKHAAPGDPLCTIGIELEAFIKPGMREILRQLEVPLMQEEDPSNRLWEVMYPWSYSAETQITMLQQLVAMHAVDPIPGLGTDLKGQERRRMALHINYGVPGDIPESVLSSPEVRERIRDLNDALIIASTSPQRLLERPRPSYSTSKEAKPSDKTSTETDELVYRLELRAFEFTEPLTYDLLYSSQRLVSSFFQWIRMGLDKKSQVPGPKEDLAQVFSKEFIRFYEAVAELRENYNIPPNFADDPDKTKAVQIVSDPEIVRAFRALIW